MRRFDIGPLIVAVGSLVLLVSTFLEWYGGESAWGAFEVADMLIAALAVAALLAADHAQLVRALERDGPGVLRGHLRASAETLGAA